MDHFPVSPDPLPRADPSEDPSEEVLTLSQFFSLPLEIREMVYNEIFPSCTVTDDNQYRSTIDLPCFELTANKWEVDSDNDCRYLLRTEFPTFLPVSRLFHAEAITAFVEGKVFEVRCRIDDDEDEEEEDPGYQALMLVRAVGTIKVPCIANRGPVSTHPAQLQMTQDDSEAIVAFERLRGDYKLLPNLVIEWTYHVYPDPATEHPSFVSSTLGSWWRKFRRVTIITKIHDHRHRKELNDEGKSKSGPNEQSLPSSQPGMFSVIMNRIYQLAEHWGWWLAGRNGTKHQQSHVSDERASQDFSGGGVYIRTMEVVDCETRRAMPLAVLEERA